MNILNLIAELEKDIAAARRALNRKKDILEVLKSKAKAMAPHFDDLKEKV